MPKTDDNAINRWSTTPRAEQERAAENGLANIQMCSGEENLLDKRLVMEKQGICKDIDIPCGGLSLSSFSFMSIGWPGGGWGRKGRKVNLWGVH